MLFSVSYVDSFAEIGDSVANNVASDEEMTALSSSDVMATLSEVVTSSPSLSSAMKMSDDSYIVITNDDMSPETRSVQLVDDSGAICTFLDAHHDVTEDDLVADDVEPQLEINIRTSVKRSHPGKRHNRAHIMIR